MQIIPFNKLSAWKGNVRQTGSNEGIEELAASIAAHGLLQSLIVRQAQEDNFQIVAGRRRFLAIGSLIDKGAMESDVGVACRVIDNSQEPLEVSLAENEMRLPMHPADRFEAFRDLVDKGMAVPDIAIRFGVSESLVSKLLKLGRVSPEVMKAYREGELDIDQVQAFAISDDAEAQNRVLEAVLQCGYRLPPHSIRAKLVEGEITATDKRVRFVGLEFYELCGGAVRRDLFDDENSGYIQDVHILEECVNSKLQATIDALKAQGWKWVEVMPDPNQEYMSQFRRVFPAECELSPEDLQALESLEQEYGEYQEQDEESEENPEFAFHMQELAQRIEAIQDKAHAWTAESKSIAGVLVSLNYDGTVRTEEGLVKPEDAAQLGVNEGSNYTRKAKPKTKPEFSATLLKDLTSYRTAALRIELARQPDIALATVVYALAMRVFYERTGGTCLKISGVQRPLFARNAEGPVPSVLALEEERKKFAVPEDMDQLWPWCLERSQDELLALLALCAAYSVDAVQQNDFRSSEGDSRHADRLSIALNLDMRKWFAPTAVNTFGRISRKQILQAYTEVTGDQPSNAVLDLKKGGLALRAERDIGGKWLPSVLRLPVSDAAA